LKVQNELIRAYSDLRNILSKERYKIPFPELEDSYKDDRANLELKKKVEDIKRSYPEIISDSEPTSSN
jgi:hypothetical protein